jgi:hypothetical protein
MRKKLMKEALLLALGEVVYVFLVATFFQNANRLFDNGKPDSFLAPVIVLMLLVLSAAISGALVLGRPLLMYLDGKKKEAMELFGYILGWLFILFILLALALVLINNIL